MRVTNMPKVGFSKSIQFMVTDPRKVISCLLTLSLPLLNHLWRIVPSDVFVPYYGDFQIFIWTFSIHAMLAVISIAWWFSINKKDYVLQLFSMASLFYAIFLCIGTIPITINTPLWLSLISTSVVFIFIFFVCYFIKNRYSTHPDYKVLHDGLIHDLNHQRFMGTVARMEGLLETCEHPDDPHIKYCLGQIKDLKGSLVFISKRYETLS